jgi:hypothetical protein
MTSTSVLTLYFAATVIFLLLDSLLGINLRVAFLDACAGWRATYYLLCFACLVLIVGRPMLAARVATTESLIARAALIISVGVGVLSIPDALLDGGGVVLSAEEIVNFAIAGGAAWLGWHRGSLAIRDPWLRCSHGQLHENGEKSADFSLKCI